MEQITLGPQISEKFGKIRSKEQLKSELEELVSRYNKFEEMPPDKQNRLCYLIDATR